MKDDILVLPRKKVLDGGGNVWEWLLCERGWNDLNCADKVGVVVGVFKLHEGTLVLDILWPTINYTSTNVFPDEVTFEGDTDEG